MLVNYKSLDTLNIRKKIPYLSLGIPFRVTYNDRICMNVTVLFT